MYQITKEKYLQNLQKRFPNDDITIIEFTAAKDPVSIQCNKCGQIFNYLRGTTLYNKRRKHFCPLCNSKTMIKFYNACKEKDIIIKGYKTNVTDFWPLHCNKCGCDFERAPSSWLKYDCPQCGYCHNLLTKEQRQQMVDEKFGINEFTVLSDGPATKHFLIKHKCGFIRKTQFSSFINSKGCPKCSKTMSKGERKIIDYLDNHNISYVSQAKMGETKQSFDFLIDNKLVIEYNGEQHYHPIKTFGGEERFLQQQEYDKKKVEFCKENNLKLFIISYKDFNNIDTILDNLFKKFNDQSQDVEEN